MAPPAPAGRIDGCQDLITNRACLARLLDGGGW